MPSPRRARRSRLPVRIAAVTVVVGVLGIVGYGIWSALQVRTDLAEAETAVQHVKTAALSGDAEATRAASAELGAAVAAAHDQVSSPVWTLAGWLPWIGDDVAGARVAIDAGYQLSQRGLPALDTLVGLLPSLRPKDGKFDVKAVGALKEPVGELADVVADVRQQLAAQDSSGYVDALGSRYRDLQNQLASAGDALGSARAVVDVLPDLLGGDTSRHYLLAFCSNAEIRATGGFPGALALLEASDGRVKISRQATMADFGERDTPVLPLTAEEEKLFGEQLGVFFGDANFTPDFGRAAQLMRARWHERFGGNVDGVIALDPITLGYLLAVTGPVTIDGHELSADTAADYLLHQVYVDYTPAEQDVFFAETARRVFAKVLAADAWTDELSALRKAAGENRLAMQFTDDAVQGVIEQYGLGGQPPPASTSPDVGFYLNDGTGAKMSYYLRYDVTVKAVSCEAGVQKLQGRAVVRSEAPADAATSLPEYVTGGLSTGIPAGEQLVGIVVLAPYGGTIGDLAIDGTRQDEDVSTFLGRKTAETFLELKPGQSWTLTWTMTSGAGQAGDVHTQVTPSAVAGSSSGTFASACR